MLIAHRSAVRLSRNRMVASAQNFAIGFFGYPFDGQFEESILIESTGVCRHFKGSNPFLCLTLFSSTTALRLMTRVFSLRSQYTIPS